MSAEHTEKEYSIFQIAVNLMLACFVSGLVIATVYFFTAPIALKNAEKAKMDSMAALVTNADKFVPIEGQEEWFEATKGGATIAYVVPSEVKGYGGKIELLVAIAPDGKVIDYTILKANETPGLGDKAGKEPFKSQIIGKTAEALVVTKDPSNKDNVQAMTGATISSKAVTLGVQNAVKEVDEFVGGSK
jgi:electron transport complex protein RnfG